LSLLTDGNGKTRSIVAIVGENPSAKRRLPPSSEIIRKMFLGKLAKLKKIVKRNEIYT
jgi:hypothetical protein